MSTPSPATNKRVASVQSPMKTSSWAHETSSPPTPEPETAAPVEAMDVDQEIDELLSDSDVEPSKTVSSSAKPSRKIAKDDEEEGVCRWEECDKTYETANELGTHMNGDHIVDKPWICHWEGCIRKGQTQASKFQLTTHCRSHTGEKPFVCQEEGCGKAFIRNDALQKHVKSHSAPAPVVAGADPLLPSNKKPAGKGKSRKSIKGAEDEDALPAHAARQKVHPPPASPVPIQQDSPAVPREILPLEEDDSRLDPAAVRSASTSVGAGAIAGPSKARVKRHATPPMEETYIPELQFNWDEAVAAGLYEDADLSEVVSLIKNTKPFWPITQADAALAESIRKRYPQKRIPANESDDEFDDKVSSQYPRDPQLVGRTLEGDTEVHVLTRPRWQVRYIMAKAKLMLVEEENRMRRDQLKDWMEREARMLKGEELGNLGAQGQAYAEMARENYKAMFGHYPQA